LAQALGADAVLRSQLSGVYDLGVHRADEAVGEVLGALGADAEGALVVVTGDHGEALGEGGHLGHKRYLDEGVLHVPLLVRYPGQTTAMSVATEVGLVDLLPTILDLAHVPLPAGLDGRSLVGIESAPGWTSNGADGRVRPVIGQLAAATGSV
jgi:arylsulfatase A-like enzyme